MPTLRRSFVRDESIVFSSQAVTQFWMFSLYDYYPKWEYEGVPSEVEKTRSLLSDFQSGNNSSLVADRVSNAILNEFPNKYELNKWHLSVIPAANHEESKIRFKNFVNRVCSNTGISSGYDFIKLRNQVEVGKVWNKNIVKNLKFDIHAVKDKNIFLFDDMITTGSSFHQSANALKASGARIIIGVFLCKTYDAANDGPPYWNNNNSFWQ
jgi:ATP-dependent DNA helicase RecQ